MSAPVRLMSCHRNVLKPFWVQRDFKGILDSLQRPTRFRMTLSSRISTLIYTLLLLLLQDFLDPLGFSYAVSLCIRLMYTVACQPKSATLRLQGWPRVVRAGMQQLGLDKPATGLMRSMNMHVLRGSSGRSAASPLGWSVPHVVDAKLGCNRMGVPNICEMN